MTASTLKECSIHLKVGVKVGAKVEGSPQVSTVLESVPCGRGVAPSNESSFRAAFIAASAVIECGSCRATDRPLWWGICGWCGADEEDFEEAA